MVKARKYIFINCLFDDFPKPEDLVLEEEELRPLKDGEFLAEAIYVSVDIHMNPKPPRFSLFIKSTLVGTQVAKITESKHQYPGYAVGKYVVGHFMWRTHTISNGDSDEVWPLLDFQGLPLSLGLGILGIPGNKAYFGFLEICKPKYGETVVVTGAAGLVGSTVGQIAKIKGCRVIGIDSDDNKGKWLTDELGFDHFINYKTQNVEEELKRVAPRGVDCYFDNIGGEISSIVINQMNRFGRISVCDEVSAHYEKNAKASVIQFAIVSNQLKMEGFSVHCVNARRSDWNVGIQQNLRWIKEGKLKYKETVTVGFENMFTAFTDMLKGVSIGKSVVKV